MNSQADLMKELLEEKEHEYKLQYDFSIYHDMNKVESDVLSHLSSFTEITTVIHEFYDSKQLTIILKCVQDQIDFITSELEELFNFTIEEPYYERMDFT